MQDRQVGERRHPLQQLQRRVPVRTNPLGALCQHFPVSASHRSKVMQPSIVPDSVVMSARERSPQK